MVNSTNLSDLIARFKSKDRLALAKLITLVENQSDGFEKVLHQLHPLTRGAYRVGITGPPGAGKSTLTEKLAVQFRKQNKTIGIIAVDPTSPFTGGAFLGDRLRMAELSLDEETFIRSMATRGSLGGLATTTEEVSDVLDAFGKDIIIVETVGVGQSELDIAAAVDTTVVVLVPESGDGIQAMKAGLMEIADVFVINKADRDGAENLASEVEVILGMRGSDVTWKPEIILTVAYKGDGVQRLEESISRHRRYLYEEGLLEQKRKARWSNHVKDIVHRQVKEFIWQRAEGENTLMKFLGEIELGKETPYTVAGKIVRKVRDRVRHT